MARIFFGLFTPRWQILGTYFAGTVTEVGSSVTRFAVGDRVAGINVVSFGAHADIDYAKEDFTEARDTYDIVFDAIGKSSFARSRRSLTREGLVHDDRSVPRTSSLKRRGVPVSADGRPRSSSPAWQDRPRCSTTSPSCTTSSSKEHSSPS